MAHNYRKAKKIWGLIEYKPQWTLTFQGFLVMFLTIVGIIGVFLSQIQPFLAYSSPIKADALVVEGWINDDGLKAAIAEFQQGHYQLLITTGSPLSKGYYLAQYKNFAELSAATAIALGFAPDQLVSIPTPKVKSDRTAASAATVKKWLSTSDTNIRSINLYSSDVHTRRSWLIFKRILAPDIQVGAIAYPSPDYDPKHWWTSSEGVRTVISETIAYLYARLVWQQ
jgi:hypothetical protein